MDQSRHIFIGKSEGAGPGGLNTAVGVLLARADAPKGEVGILVEKEHAVVVRLPGEAKFPGPYVADTGVMDLAIALMGPFPVISNLRFQ